MLWVYILIVATVISTPVVSFNEKLRYGKFVELIYGNSANFDCVCGRSNYQSKIENTKIVGGEIIETHKYPWMVQLTYNGTYICGGSIINDRYILSAAHCLNSLIEGGEFQLGNLKIVTGSPDRCNYNIQTTIFSILEIKIHPKFNPQNFDYDIALFKLNMKISFNKFIKPVCLPKNGLNYNTEVKAEVIGWGRIASNNLENSCYLRRVSMPVLQSQVCDQLDALNQYERPTTLICAGSIQGGQDACQGDSGSPLQVENESKYYQIGVVSTGFGCANPLQPGYYTDLIRFIPWILDNTIDSAYCW